jgi:hypothetical protein
MHNRKRILENQVSMRKRCGGAGTRRRRSPAGRTPSLAFANQWEVRLCKEVAQAERGHLAFSENKRAECVDIERPDVILCLRLNSQRTDACPIARKCFSSSVLAVARLFFDKSVGGD